MWAGGICFCHARARVLLHQRWGGHVARLRADGSPSTPHFVRASEQYAASDLDARASLAGSEVQAAVASCAWAQRGASLPPQYQHFANTRRRPPRGRGDQSQHMRRPDIAAVQRVARAHASSEDALLGSGFRGRSALLNACVLPFTEGGRAPAAPRHAGGHAEGRPPGGGGGGSGDNPFNLAAKLFRSVLDPVTEASLRKALLLRADDYGLSPLLAVAGCGGTKIMREYIKSVLELPLSEAERRAWLCATTCDGFNVFHAALLSGNAGSYNRVMSETKRARLHQGHGPNLLLQMLTAPTGHGATPLHTAASCGAHSCLSHLVSTLEHHAPHANDLLSALTARTCDGYTPLHHALLRGEPGVAATLLGAMEAAAASAAPAQDARLVIDTALSAPASDGATPLQCAALGGDQALRCFLEHSARLRDKLGAQPPGGRPQHGEGHGAALQADGSGGRGNPAAARVLPDADAVRGLCRVVQQADQGAVATYLAQIGVDKLPPAAVVHLFTTPCEVPADGTDGARARTTAWLEALESGNAAVMEHTTALVVAAAHDALDEVGREDAGQDANQDAGGSGKALGWAQLLEARPCAGSLSPLHTIACSAPLLALLDGTAIGSARHAMPLRGFLAMLTATGEDSGAPSPLAQAFQYGSRDAVAGLVQQFRTVWGSLDDVSPTMRLRRACLQPDHRGDTMLQKAAQNTDPDVLDEGLALALELGLSPHELAVLCGNRRCGRTLLQHILERGSRTAMRRFGMLLLPGAVQSPARRQFAWDILTRHSDGQSALGAALLCEPQICENYIAMLFQCVDDGGGTQAERAVDNFNNFSGSSAPGGVHTERLREYLTKACTQHGTAFFSHLDPDLRAEAHAKGRGTKGAAHPPAAPVAAHIEAAHLFFDMLERVDATPKDCCELVTLKRAGKTMLHGILRSGEAGLVRRVVAVAERAELGDQARQEWLTAPAKNGATPLHQVLHSGDAESAQLYFALLHQSAVLDAAVYLRLLIGPSKSGITPLHAVLMSSSQDALQVYLDALGDAGISDHELRALLTDATASQTTPLDMVMRHGTLASLKWFLGALQEACLSDEMYARLLTGGDGNAFVPLHSLLRRDNDAIGTSGSTREVLRTYMAEVTRLELGTKDMRHLLTARNVDGFTPLHHAASYQSLAVIKMVVATIRAVGNQVLLDNLSCRTRFG